jgi:hypothetical protein
MALNITGSPIRYINRNKIDKTPWGAYMPPNCFVTVELRKTIQLYTETEGTQSKKMTYHDVVFVPSFQTI